MEQIKSAFGQCLHCGAECLVDADQWHFNCLRCGWVNDLEWEGHASAGWDSPPIEILPADAYKKTVPFQVAYPPIFQNEFRRLSQTQRDRIKEIIAKKVLSQEEFTLLKHAQHGAEKFGDPWKMKIVNYGSSSAISVPSAMVEANVLKADVAYTVFIADKQFPHCQLKLMSEKRAIPLQAKLEPGEYDCWIVRE
jgi:hypothetical protein